MNFLVLLFARLLTVLGIAPGAYSRAVAHARGVGRLQYATRDTATLDLDSDLSRLSSGQLVQVAATLRARLEAPQAGDDIPAMVARSNAVLTALDAANAQRDAADAALARLAQAAGRPDPVQRDTTQRAGERDDDDEPQAAAPVTLGRAFVQSGVLSRYNGRGQSETVPVQTRALFGTANFPSTPTRVPGVQIDRDTPLTILDLIDRQTIDTNMVEWVREDGYPNSAAEVAEGAQKPESTFALSLVQSAASTIAHWVQITRQALQDEGQIRGYVDGRLTYGLLRRLNAQVLNGNGTAPNLRGILNTTGIGTYVSAAGEQLVIAVRKALTVAQLSEYEPDAVVVHPTDWQNAELSTDTSGRFRIAPDVTVGAARRLWGLAVIVTTNITAATFLVGNFREGATLWERTGVDIYITDSHGSNFTANILVLLAELRAILSVWRPKAFVKGTLTP